MCAVAVAEVADGLDLGAVYAAEWPPLVEFIRVRTRGTTEYVEDVAAMTFEKALRYAPGYQEKGFGPGPWLRQIARTVIVDVQRGRERADRFENGLWKKRHFPGESWKFAHEQLSLDEGAKIDPSAEDVVIEQEHISEVRATLETLMWPLTDTERETIQRVVLDGIKPRAYARSLGVSVVTVKHRKARAMAKMRKLAETIDR